MAYAATSSAFALPAPAVVTDKVALRTDATDCWLGGGQGEVVVWPGLRRCGPRRRGGNDGRLGLHRDDGAIASTGQSGQGEGIWLALTGWFGGRVVIGRGIGATEGN